MLNWRRKVRLSDLKSPPLRRFPRCPTSFLVTALQSLLLILPFLYQVLIFRARSVLSIGLRLTVVRVLAVALLVAVSAIPGISAPSFSLDVIEHGYRISFHSTPPVSFSSNNKSALAHSDFVNEAISEFWLPIAFLNRRSCPTTSILFPFLFSHLGKRG